MMRALNPYAALTDVMRTLKRTAQRPAGTGWSATSAGGSSTPARRSTRSAAWTAWRPSRA